MKKSGNKYNFKTQKKSTPTRYFELNNTVIKQEKRNY